MRQTDRYTTELSQGTALLNETLSLLPYYRQGMKRSELLDIVLKEGILPSCTEVRVDHILEKVFFNRFVKPNNQIPFWLKLIREKGLMLKEFSQIAMVYCARVHRVYYDFIIDVLNGYRERGESKLPRDVADDYMMDIVKRGEAKWAESMQHKNATYLRNTLSSFELINSKCEILPYPISDFVILYFMHELHFSGLSDVAIINDSDWQVLGLEKEELIRRVLEMNMKGGYIAQRCGDLITISWNYKSMEEFINAAL